MSKTSNLKKMTNEEREDKFGYVFAVSGPGELILELHTTNNPRLNYKIQF